MNAVQFYTDVPSGPADRMWQDSNRALQRLITRHQAGLERSMSIGQMILHLLESIFPLLDELCRSTCRWCPEPCCIVNKVWINFQDLLFLHLTGCSIPPGQLCGDQYAPCRYLGRNGCRLPRRIRPWGCTQYICSTQKKRLEKNHAGRQKHLEETIHAIRLARLDMEESFIEVVSNHRRKTGSNPEGRQGHGVRAINPPR
jgi:hypothetical protein